MKVRLETGKDLYLKIILESLQTQINIEERRIDRLRWMVFALTMAVLLLTVKIILLSI